MRRSGGDLFDPILLADKRFHGEGYQEGYNEGGHSGVIEGRRFGSINGAKIGSEVAFYSGFAFTWKCILQNNTDAKSRYRDEHSVLLSFLLCF
uniref:Oral cancer overexpressed protein 1 n=1 Tax=Callorhinchus milii TaxID=7868 RepID=V9LKH4_CALMI